MRRLQERRAGHRSTRTAIGNDVLIALSARAIGATVVTRNGRDFRIIQAVRPFSLEVVE